MVEKGADEIIHRVYIIIRKKRKKKTPTKNQMFFSEYKKTKKTKKKNSYVSSSRNCQFYFHALRHIISWWRLAIILNEMARELQTIIIFKMYKTVYREIDAVLSCPRLGFPSHLVL